MPSGYPFSAVVRRRFIELVCSGVVIDSAAAQMGVSHSGAWLWWRQVTSMSLLQVRTAVEQGLCADDELSRPGGRGHRLNRFDRGGIQLGLDLEVSITKIGELIGRDKSVVSREIARNRADDGNYYAALADLKAHHNARRPKDFKLVDRADLCAVIEKWMDDGWSPKLIATMLRRQFPDDQDMHVSHETIYQCLYVQTRGQLRKDLALRLSTRRKARKPQSRNGQRRGKFNDALKIADRPPEADNRAIPGHWEGDLIVGAGSRSAIGTLVERSTRFTLLLHLDGDHTAETVTTAMIAAMKDLPEHLRRSITWDRGAEIAAYDRIKIELGAPVYLCDPHCPWQRGTNENTNRLLRHWFTKGTDLTIWTAADLKRIQDTLNRRPRPTLDLRTPAQALNDLLLKAA
jgi:IS30 family transposase